MWGIGILVSPPSPWREGFWTSPSFLWKEGEGGRGWLPQRDETKSETAHPPVSSSRVQPRDLSCRRENSTYEEVRHSKSYEVRCLPLSHIFCLTSVQGRFLDFARNDDTGKALLSFSACLRRISPLSFIPPVPYPPLWGTFPSRGRLWVWGIGILVSPPSPWREGFWTSPSFLWKEGEGGRGWLPQRDETKSETAHPPVSSSRVQPRDLSCRRENSTYEEVRHSKSYEVRCLPLISHSPFHRCARKISRFARNDDTRKALLSFFACLRRISPLAFIPPVPYPPLRDTFPSRGRLFMTSGEAAPFISHSSRVFFYFFSQYATSVSAAPMPRAVLMPMPVYMAKEARVAARLAAMSFLKKP